MHGESHVYLSPKTVARKLLSTLTFHFISGSQFSRHTQLSLTAFLFKVCIHTTNENNIRWVVKSEKLRIQKPKGEFPIFVQKREILANRIMPSGPKPHTVRACPAYFFLSVALASRFGHYLNFIPLHF